MEEMPLFIHLSIHLFFALATGYLVGYFFKEIRLGLVAGLLGGFYVDLDHVLEYFLILGWRFNLTDFLKGQQFLVSEHIYLLFHGWEFVLDLLLLAYLIRKKHRVMIFIIALAISLFVHLVSDCFINNYSPRNYSLIYRWQNNFAVEKILNPQQYENFVKYKQYLGS